MEAITMPERHRVSDEFTATDQRVLGDAWRHELVDGHVIAHAGPAPDHGAIIAGPAPGASVT